jgi:hypothetical protein
VEPARSWFFLAVMMFAPWPEVAEIEPKVCGKAGEHGTDDREELKESTSSFLALPLG